MSQDQSPSSAPSTEYAGVRITEEGIASVKKGVPTFSLPHHRIREVALRRGFQAERPIVQPAFGAVLAVAGLFPLWEVVLWLQQGGTLYDVTVLLLWLVPLGVLLVVHGLRRGYYLAVRLTDDRFKIPFRGRPSREGIDRFLRDAAGRAGYEVRIEV